MRLKIIFSKNSIKVPNNLFVSNGWLHNCLGRNNKYHDTPSNYSVSRLMGGNIIDGGRFFDFPNGGFIVVSSDDTELMEKIVNNASNVDLGYGMEFQYVKPISEELFDGYNFFKTTDTGILLKSFNGENEVNHTINDADFVEVLTQRTIKRLQTINPKLKFDGFKIEISEHKNNKVKRTFVGNRANTSSVCQFVIHSNKKVAEAIYNYGLGQSTGSGFGMVYKTENNLHYK